MPLFPSKSVGLATCTLAAAFALLESRAAGAPAPFGGEAVALAVTPAAAHAPAQELSGVKLEFPESLAARAVAGIAAETAPAPLPAAARLAAPDTWEDIAGWRLWAETLRAEVDSPASEGSPMRRALLSRMAASQGRDTSAWLHFAQLVASPEQAAGTLPYLFPGIPPELTPAPGGLPPELPDGCLLRPALPPTRPGWTPLAYREAKLLGLHIGAAVVDLSLTVESTGVQVDITHVSGGPAVVEVLLPEPEGYEIRVEYVDWMRQDERHVPLRVELLPGAETSSLFGRVLDRPLGRPNHRPGAPMPAQLRLGGLVLALHEGAARRPFWSELCGLLSELIGIEVRLADEPAAGEAGQAAFQGTRIELAADPGQRLLTLRYLAEQIENALLTRD